MARFYHLAEDDSLNTYANLYEIRDDSLFVTLSRWSAVALLFFAPLSTTGADIFSIATPVLFLLSGHWRRHFAFFATHRVAQLSLGLFALFCLGLLWSIAPWHEAVHVLSKYDKLLILPFLIPVFADEKTRQYALRAFLAAMFIMLLFSYLKVLGWLHFQSRFGTASVFKGHIEGGFLMALAGYFMAIKAIHNDRHRWFCAISGLLFAHNALFLSSGRSGYVVLAVLIALLLWQQFGWRGLFASVGLVCVLGLTAFFVSPTFNTRIKAIRTDVIKREQGKSSSVGLRITFAENAVKLIRKRPLMGYGTGGFSRAYATIRPLPKTLTTNPHDEYLNVAAQLGVLGLVLLLCLFYRQWRDSFLLPTEYRYIAQAMLLSIAVGSLANSWLMDTTQGHLYVSIMALAFAAYPYRRRVVSA